ncbi:aromatic acid exporter family protein [Helcococcus kunzii]|uniref:aromatic acid exporter family protein n=1 Tax=Helcococcus kunzii TaxID=40091 RepID=UPI0024ADF590|nr:aromatic acid exporter family protein [Helcococcus kunzii]
MKSLKKYNLILNLQIAIAFLFSILLANFLDLQNYVTAGIITILSIQDTKKKTLEIAYRRFLGYVIMLALVYLVFNIMGYSILSFGFFVLIFALINSRLDISIGLAPNVVMASHFFLKGHMELSFIWNETLVYLIGLLMAIIVNLLIPMTNKDNNRGMLDDKIKNLLMYISNILNEKHLEDENKSEYIEYISKEISDTNRFFSVYENEIINRLENDLFNNDFYDLEYLNLRRKQYNILIKIFELSKNIDRNLVHTQKISEFIEEIYLGYYEKNTAISLIEKADTLLIFFKNLSLPKTREEFENRANLYIILEDLIQFLEEKYKFSRGSYEI